MIFLGAGVAEHSHLYFYTPSQNAKKLLYYPITAGNFYCNSNYCVERESYNSILAIFVVDGNITVEQNGMHTACKNELLLVDCYKKHKYYTNDFAHTLWVHFDGNNSRIWFDELNTYKIKCPADTAEQMLKIIDNIKLNANEYEISQNLYSFLCNISSPQISLHSDKLSQISLAKKYIVANFENQISVDDIAKSVNMSSSYFSKIFKEATILSPYEYLLSIRLEKAKELLQKTDLSISQIAYKTGFNSDANFIYFFKKQTSVSPLKFRNIDF